jgi:hypothetical protein
MFSRDERFEEGGKRLASYFLSLVLRLETIFFLCIAFDDEVGFCAFCVDDGNIMRDEGPEYLLILSFVDSLLSIDAVLVLVLMPRRRVFPLPRVNGLSGSDVLCIVSFLHKTTDELLVGLDTLLSAFTGTSRIIVGC